MGLLNISEFYSKRQECINYLTIIVRDNSIRIYMTCMVVLEFCFIKYHFEINNPPVRDWDFEKSMFKNASRGGAKMVA